MLARHTNAPARVVIILLTVSGRSGKDGGAVLLDKARPLCSTVLRVLAITSTAALVVGGASLLACLHTVLSLATALPDSLA